MSKHNSFSTDALRCGYLLILLLPWRAFADASPAESRSEYLQNQTSILAPTALVSGKMIGMVNIETGNVFDTNEAEEDKFLFRLANRLHTTTRPGVVRQQLLFKPGEPYSGRTLEETERLLRTNRYLQNATIEPVTNDAGLVDVHVRTIDSWTLIPKLALSRSGGANKSSIGLKEMNLFGRGVLVEALYKSDVDRDSKILKVVDRHVGNSWYSVKAIYANNSDGHNYVFDLGMPFYSLNSKSAHGVSIFDGDQIDSLYDRGEIAAQYQHQSSSYKFFKGWSRGLDNGWVRRFSTGIGYDEHQFTSTNDPTLATTIVPTDRKFVYPFVSFEVLQDKFEKSENYDQIRRTEDRYLGTRFEAGLGVARDTFGSDRNAWLVNASAQTGFGTSKNTSLILASSFATRLEGSGAENLMVDVSARYYRRQSDKRLFYASLTGTFGNNLDIDNPLLLGGDNGLRGYPLRYQAGDKRALLTLEQRVFTDWYPFRLFRVGAAVFFDAGRAWGESPVSNSRNELLKDVGFGLRIGNSRSGEGRTTHIDFAFPLDGDSGIKDFQFVVQTKRSF